MKYFLLVYDRSQGLLRDCIEYEGAQRDLAWKDRVAREMKERHKPDMEVVLLGAESLEALKETHGRYFSSAEELLRDLGLHTREMASK